MSFFRVSNPVATPFDIVDLGITIAASATNVVLSNQFSVDDLYLSADLEAAIIAGDLDVDIDYGTGFTAIAAVDYTNRDAIAAFLNVYEITNENDNEELVNGADTALHNHDGMYYTETELGSTTAGSSGGTLIGVNDDAWDTEWPFTFTTVQGFIDGLYTILNTAFDLDSAYDQDSDGILNVDGTTKPLDLRSDNVNDIYISRFATPDLQKVVWFDVSANEVLLGSAVVGALAAVNVHIPTNLTIDGNLTVTGTVTDTTVDTLNITNANIRLRDGATGIAAADAYIEVERGTTGADSQLFWNESTDRWQAGIVGNLGTIALLEFNELVTGIWEFQGGSATDPNMYLDNKAAAPTTNLGAADQIPISMINNSPAYYDKTNSRNTFLSYYRQHAYFQGRDSANNKDEYMRIGAFTSNQSGYRLLHNMKLVGVSVQAENSATYNIRIRKNGSVTNLASLAVTAATGAHLNTYNLDLDAGDAIQVYLDSAGVNVSRPSITLEMAERF
jgi:hypothetical protein